MTARTSKSMKPLVPVAAAMDAIVLERHEKGSQQRIYGAAALMYLTASPTQRLAFEVWDAAISHGLATIDTPPEIDFSQAPPAIDGGSNGQ